MEIKVVTLKEMEFVEVEGEFKQVFKDEKKVPCFVTNQSMNKGKMLGLIKGSLIADLFKLENLESKNSEKKAEAMQSLDLTEMQKLIYLGVLGANKDLTLDFDEFLGKFHYSFDETASVYMALLESLMGQDSNKFAKGLQKSTSTKQGKK
ncbi:hypothetical protein ABEV54_18240 [Peribacillus psychrosaccharolyticus]|uniref:hypothetical protein n=1 Tax=Peribacillus psychrosaccharolyticus TaxID=1407 RepID=UPI003D277E61